MKWIAALLLAAAFQGSTLNAAIIYDNSSSSENTYADDLFEYGDEITLAGSERLLTNFSFEYYANYIPSGDETARLRLYLNDAPAGDNPSNSPGSLLYDSGAFNIQPDYHTVNISDLALYLPANTITWTVEFSGIDSSGSAGLLFYSTPTVGSSADYYWENTNGVWQAVQSDALENNFAAQLSAVQAVTISSIQKSGSNLVITASTTPGQTYALEFTTNFVDWTRVTPSTPSPGSSVQFTQTIDSPNKFFRVVQI